MLWRIPTYKIIHESYINKNYELLEKEASKTFKTVWSALDRNSKQKYLKVEAVKRIVSSKIIVKGDYIYSNFYQYNKASILLSDNPILINRHPGYNFEVSEPLIFPLSDRKMYVRSDIKCFKFKDEMIADYNLLTLHQAKFYVASENKNLLESCVNYYRSIKDSFGIIADDAKMKMFREINEN